MDLMLFAIGIILSIIGFFLVKFYNSVEEIKKGVNQMLINRAAKDQEIKQISEDVHEIKVNQAQQDRRLQKVEIEIAKITKQ